MAVKIGMISFAHMHAMSYAACVQENPDAEFVGISDIDSARGKHVAQQFDTEYFESDEALFDAGIDAVIITTENARHREKTEAAAAAGLDVMCEKPISVSVEDAQAMIDACDEAGVQLMTAFPCRYGPAYIEVQKMVDAGDLGDILAIKGTNRGRNPGGWFVEPELSGGGATMDHTVHVADLMRQITGAEVSEVFCQMDTFFNPELECDDAGLISMEFTSGCVGTLDCSWSRPPHFPIWGDATMCIIGSEGNAWIDLFREHVDVYQNDQQSYTWASYGSNTDYGLVAEFCDCVESGRPVPITGYDGLKAMEVALAAYESAEAGEKIALPLE